MLGFPEGSLEALELGIEAASELGDRKSLIRFYSNAGTYHSSKGKRDQGMAFVQKAYEEAHAIEDITAMAQTTPDLVFMKLSEGRYSDVVELASRLIEAIRKEGRELDNFGGPAVVVPAFLSTSGYALSNLGRFAETPHKFQEALEIASQTDSVFTRVVCNIYPARSMALQGRWKEAKVFYLAALQHLERATLPSLEAWVKSGLGVVETYLGDPKYGEQLVKEARSCLKAANTDWRRSNIFFCQGVCAHEAGGMKKAHALMDNALRLATKENEVELLGRSLMWKGRIARQLAGQSLAAAKNDIMKGLKIHLDLEMRPDAAKGYLFLGEHYAALSETEQALVHLRTAEDSFAAMDMEYWLNVAQQLAKSLDTAKKR
jgi:tetratricopeptide (TPR) repeat protein